jgi:hypothetical protein
MKNHVRWTWFLQCWISSFPKVLKGVKVMKNAMFYVLLPVAAVVCCAVPVVGNLAVELVPGVPVLVSEDEAAQVRGGTCPSSTNGWFTATTC